MLTKVHIVSVVGDDYPPEYFSWLTQRGVDAEGVQVQPGETFRWAGRYDEDFGEPETLAVELNVLESFDVNLSRCSADASFLFVANNDPVLQLDALRRFESRRFALVDTQAIWVITKRRELLEVLSQVQGFICNLEEVAALTGTRNLPAAIEVVHSLGPQVVIIKQGARGATLSSGGELFSVPGFPVRDVVDPTGAGDTFAGGFIGHLASVGRVDIPALRRATVVGNVLASFAVEGFGVHRLLHVTAAELEERMRLVQR